MAISTIIPTIGRPSLSAAIQSVLDQGLDPPEFEIIVVNDSGEPLQVGEWLALENIKVIETNRRNRSVARNVGAAASRGQYLHFLDDDDFMLPGAFRSLLQIAETTDAAWIHGGFRMVDNAGATVGDLFPDETGNCSIQMMAWEWLPLQASLIRADAFFRVDGFASLPSLGGGFEDVHLSRQISLYFAMACTDYLVATIRIGEVSSTTTYVTMFDQNRHSREKTIAAPHAFQRLIASAKSSPSRPNYWFGKVIYYYMASVKRNLQDRQFFTAASRAAYLLAGLGLAGVRSLSAEFWRGVIRPHYPRMGTAIQEAGADHLYANTRRVSVDKHKPDVRTGIHECFALPLSPLWDAPH
jgi:glycosyltransferase involved in cell wall biosynthesis